MAFIRLIGSARIKRKVIIARTLAAITAVIPALGGVAGIQNQAGGHNLFRLVKLPAKIQFAPDDPDNLNLTTH